MRVTRVSVVCFVIVLATAPRLRAQEPFAEARQLYASAEYEDALKLLDGLTVGDHVPEQRQDLELYRALCLVALDRPADADRAIEKMIAQNPLYRPADDLSPRMRSAFRDTKKRVLPGIVQQHYAQAKGAFDRQEFAAAATGFGEVVDALNDPDIAEAAARPPLSDLRMLASGFHDLSKKAIPPPVLVSVALAPAPPAPVNLPPRIYKGGEVGVVPPVAIRQDLPRFTLPVRQGGVSGTVEIVINEAGAVESATMVEPVTPTYDPLVLAAANSWAYQPATVKGAPVKFRKVIRIAVAEP